MLVKETNYVVFERQDRYLSHVIDEKFTKEDVKDYCMKNISWLWNSVTSYAIGSEISDLSKNTYENGLGKVEIFYSTCNYFW